MPDPPPSLEPRRRFLGRLGATLAAGLGLAGFGGSAALADVRPRTIPAPSEKQVARDTSACLIYCYPQSCPGGCCSGKNLFRCVDQCAPTWYSCLAHSCSSYCFSSNIC